MRFIGITGGVGAGKSAILQYLKDNYNGYIVLADDVAKELMNPGGSCYEQILPLFETDITRADGQLDSQKMAQEMFADERKRMAVNAIVHPAVKQQILSMVDEQRQMKDRAYFFLEAALLIEEHYDEICDELWYIYTNQDVRRARLLVDRGYTNEKINQIFQSQLSEQEFRVHCQRVIDNSGTLDHTFAQIDQILGQIRT